MKRSSLLSWKSNYFRVNDFYIMGIFLEITDSPDKIQHYLCNQRKLSHQLACLVHKFFSGILSLAKWTTWKHFRACSCLQHRPGIHTLVHIRSFGFSSMVCPVRCLNCGAKQSQEDEMEASGPWKSGERLPNSREMLYVFDITLSTFVNF